MINGVKGANFAPFILSEYFKAPKIDLKLLKPFSYFCSEIKNKENENQRNLT